MSPDYLAEIRYRAADGYRPTVADTQSLLDYIEQLEAALLPFTLVVIGEHREDHDNVWHSLKVYHFRDARKVMKGGAIV